MSGRCKYYLRSRNSEGEPLSKKGRQEALFSTTLTDLPVEMVQLILAKAKDEDTFLSLRATSVHMRAIVDSYIMHRYRKFLNDYSKKDPRNDVSSVFRVITVASEVFKRYRCETPFCLAILPLIVALNNNLATPYMMDNVMKRFLNHYFSSIDEKMLRQEMPKMRTAAAMTLLHVLKQFGKTFIVFSSNSPVKLRVQFSMDETRMPSPWIRSMNKISRINLRKATNATAFFCELLFHFIRGNAWVPRTVYNCYLLGPPNICTLLISCFEDENFVWPDELPEEFFQMQVNIASDNFVNWSYWLPLIVTEE